MPGRKRAESVSIVVEDRNKRLKSEHGPVKVTNHVTNFADGLFNDSNVQELNRSYKDSGPFLHVVVDELLQNDLLSKVKGECLGELSFSEKETDIYKVSCMCRCFSCRTRRKAGRSTKRGTSPLFRT